LKHWAVGTLRKRSRWDKVSSLYFVTFHRLYLPSTTFAALFYSSTFIAPIRTLFYSKPIVVPTPDSVLLGLYRISIVSYITRCTRIIGGTLKLCTVPVYAHAPFAPKFSNNSSYLSNYPQLPVRRLPAPQIRLNSRPLCAIQIIVLYCVVFDFEIKPCFTKRLPEVCVIG